MNTGENEAKKSVLKDTGAFSYGRPRTDMGARERVSGKYEAMYFDPSHPILLPLNHAPSGASFPRGWVREPVIQSQERRTQNKEDISSAQLSRFVEERLTELLGFPFNTAKSRPRERDCSISTSV